jgi:hypothetical protein
VKRVIGIVGGLVFVFFLGRWLFIALASDETHIRWLVERMEQGYNRADVSDCVGPLAEDWTHEGYAVEREMVANAIRADYLQDRDRETKELRRRVDVDEDTLVIEVDDGTAHLTVEARFERLQEGQWSETWAMRAEAELRETEDGWKIWRSRHEDLRGTQLSR